MTRNRLETADEVLNKHIRGELSKPLLRAWMRGGVHPVQNALEAVIEQERYRHLKDFLFMAIMVGGLGAILSLLAGLVFFPLLRIVAYGLGTITAVAIVASILVYRSSRQETVSGRWAQEFIDDYDVFVQVTSSLEDERFSKLKTEELKERGHSALAHCALVVREIEVAGEGISPIHWEQHKKEAAESLERVYQLMRRFKFVGDEGYKPYYAMAEELLKKKQTA